MTKDKDRKRLVRSRMAATGERYTQAMAALNAHTTESQLDQSAECRLWVQRLADKATRIEAFEKLAGGLTATDLRQVTQVPESAFTALVERLADDNPKIRWWCIQILDHVADERALHAVVPLLDDPVDRVRRNAAHAIGCVGCKPTAERSIPDSVLTKLTTLATSDPSAKVRKEASWALACRTGTWTTHR